MEKQSSPLNLEQNVLLGRSFALPLSLVILLRKTQYYYSFDGVSMFIHFVFRVSVEMWFS